jgi:hypothetical protein
MTWAWVVLAGESIGWPRFAEPSRMSIEDYPARDAR